MRVQNDLETIAKFTRGIATATNDPGALLANYQVDVAADELAGLGETTAILRMRDIGARCLNAKAEMVRACVVMVQEAETVQKASKDAATKVNDAAGKMAQSLQRTRDMMGPQVEERLKQLERFVACLEALRELEADGTTTRLMAALKR